MQIIAISDNTHTNFTKKKKFNSINEINYKCTLWILEELLFFRRTIIFYHICMIYRNDFN